MKEELANMSEEESTRFEPVFKFGDEEAKTALKTELAWLIRANLKRSRR